MKTNELLRNRFAMTGHERVSDWRRETNCPITLESATSILLRGKKPSLESALIMAILLGAPNAELVDICKDLGDRVIYHRFVETGTPDEQALLSKFRLLSKKDKATINRELATIKRIFSLHTQWHAAAGSPRLHAAASDIANVPPLPENNLKKRFLSDDEARRLLDACTIPYVRMAVYTALCTGLRLSNVLGLTWAQIRRGEIHISGDTTKNSDDLVLPVSAGLAASLSAWKKQQPFKSRFVFPAPSADVKHDKPIATIRRAFTTALKNAGLEDVSFHTLRHTFASQFIMHGGDIATASELLGHSDISITKRRYAHLSGEHKKAAVADFDNSFLSKL